MKFAAETEFQLKTWIPLLIIFLLIFAWCVFTIFTRPIESFEVLIHEGSSTRWETVVISPSALSVAGLGQLGEAWKKYPDYVVGLGVAAAMALFGAFWCVMNIERGQDKTE